MAGLVANVIIIMPCAFIISFEHNIFKKNDNTRRSFVSLR